MCDRRRDQVFNDTAYGTDGYSPVSFDQLISISSYIICCAEKLTTLFHLNTFKHVYMNLCVDVIHLVLIIVPREMTE